MMSHRTSLLVAAALAALVAACGSSAKPVAPSAKRVDPSAEPVDYLPQPGRVVQPQVALSTLVMANTPPGCTSQNGYAAKMLVVKFVCNHGLGSKVLRFDRIESLRLEHGGEWYYVRVHHRGGVDDFYWASKSLEDAQSMADAIAAIALQKPPPPPPPPPVPGSQTQT